MSDNPRAFIQGRQDVSDLIVNKNFGSYERPTLTDKYYDTTYLDDASKYVLTGTQAYTNFNVEAIALTKDFNPSLLPKVGCWFPIGGSDTGNPYNRYVKQINPFRSRLQDGYGGLSSGMYNSGFLNRIHPSYNAFFEINVQETLNYLDSAWSDTTFGTTLNPVHERVTLLFDHPHGIRHPNLEGASPIAAVEAIEDGLPHLVRGFYGACIQLRRLGIRCLVNLGSPDTNNIVIDPNDERLLKAYKYCESGGVVKGYDRPCSFPENSITWNEIHKYNETTKYGVTINDVPLPTNTSWLKPNYPIAVKESRLRELFYPNSSGNPLNGTAVSGYPSVRTPSWSGTYQNTWFFVQVEESSFAAMSGTNTPYGTSGNATGWLGALATGCKNLTTAFGPKTIVLLPYIAINKLARGFAFGVYNTGSFTNN